MTAPGGGTGPDRASGRDRATGRPVRVAVDLPGGDDAPGVVLAGVREALAADPALQVVLAGRAEDAAPPAGRTPTWTRRSAGACG